MIEKVVIVNPSIMRLLINRLLGHNEPPELPGLVPLERIVLGEAITKEVLIIKRLHLDELVEPPLPRGLHNPRVLLKVLPDEHHQEQEV